MDDEARFDKLLELLDELIEANDATPIVVEGARDVASLRSVGCRGAILPLHRGEPLPVVAEAVAAHAREVILLTDWDRKGEILRQTLRTQLAASGVRADTTWRDKLRNATRPPLKDVESLAAYVARGLARWRGASLDERFGRG